MGEQVQNFISVPPPGSFSSYSHASNQSETLYVHWNSGCWGGNPSCEGSGVLIMSGVRGNRYMAGRRQGKRMMELKRKI